VNVKKIVISIALIAFAVVVIKSCAKASSENKNHYLSGVTAGDLRETLKAKAFNDKGMEISKDGTCYWELNNRENPEFFYQVALYGSSSTKLHSVQAMAQYYGAGDKVIAKKLSPFILYIASLPIDGVDQKVAVGKIQDILLKSQNTREIHASFNVSVVHYRIDKKYRTIMLTIEHINAERELIQRLIE